MWQLIHLASLGWTRNTDDRNAVDVPISYGSFKAWLVLSRNDCNVVHCASVSHVDHWIGVEGAVIITQLLGFLLALAAEIGSTGIRELFLPDNSPRPNADFLGAVLR